MDGVSYLAMDKADQRKVRKEMLKIADKMFRDSGLGRVMARASARNLVNAALAKERDGDIEGSNPQRIA